MYNIEIEDGRKAPYKPSKKKSFHNYKHAYLVYVLYQTKLFNGNIVNLSVKGYLKFCLQFLFQPVFVIV